MNLHERRESSSHNVALLAAAGVGLFLAARSAVRSSRRMDFGGRTVLITGGSRGLGLVLARQFAREGANLAICARDAADLERARAELDASGADVLAVPCDVGDPVQVAEFVRRAGDRFGRIDVLINNAGTITVGPMNVMTPGDYELAMRTHFWGPLHATLAVLPRMRRQGAGRIVNISSIGGKVAVPHLLPYSASKFALTGFSEGLRAELLKEGIYVTTVNPGLMRTGSPRNANFKGDHRAEYAWFSISDSLPVTSMAANRAASQIIRATRYGQAEVTLSIQAKIAAKFHAVFPGLSADFNGLIARMLPDARPTQNRAFAGKDSTSEWSPSWMTALTERAAVANNEMR